MQREQQLTTSGTEAPDSGPTGRRHTRTAYDEGGRLWRMIRRHSVSHPFRANQSPVVSETPC
jgi:hypothetical protein